MAYKQSPRGNYKKTGHGIPGPFKQVDEQVDKMIADKKAREAKAKSDKVRKAGEEGMIADNKRIRMERVKELAKKASSDSTAVDTKMRSAGFGSIMAGKMGNEKANETRKAGSPYPNAYESVDKDKTTGKYKKTTKFKSN